MSTLGITTPYPAARRAEIADLRTNWTMWAALWAAQAGLAILMKQYQVIASTHAILTVLAAIGIAMFARSVDRAAYCCAYIVGAEVLWRMCRANLVWEYGKYSLCIVLIIALLRLKHLVPHRYATLFLLLLIPGAISGYFVLGAEEWRKQASFNLSGPFALFLSVYFFHNISFDFARIRNLMLTCITPIIGVAAVTAFTTYTATEIRFSLNSNFRTSGGFGANQVSAILGLGALLALLYLLNSPAGKKQKLLIGASAVFLLMQCVMTFSRGGLYGAAGAALPALYFLGQQPRYRPKIILALGSLVFCGLLIFPILNKFTGGFLRARFEQTTTTGRSELMETDLQLWRDNFVMGVGVGVSNLQHFDGAASHTEQTRLLAEHGLFGVAALVIMLLIFFDSFGRTHDIQEKALVCCLFLWSFLFMLTAGMRLAAPAFVIGMSCIHFRRQAAR